MSLDAHAANTTRLNTKTAKIPKILFISSVSYRRHKVGIIENLIQNFSVIIS